MLTTNQTNISLGKVKKGESRSFSYEITNTSSSAIQVDTLKTGCSSCTTASIDTSTIPPSQKVKVHAVFTPTSTGAQVKNIYIIYGSDKLTLKFNAEVW